MAVLLAPDIELAVIAELDDIIIAVAVEIPVFRSFRYFETQCLDEGTLGVPVLLVNIDNRFWGLLEDKDRSFFVPPPGLLPEVGIGLYFFVLAKESVEIICPAF